MLGGPALMELYPGIKPADFGPGGLTLREYEALVRHYQKSVDLK